MEQHVYPEARHEVFNETNRDEVVGDLLAWLEARSPDSALTWRISSCAIALLFEHMIEHVEDGDDGVRSAADVARASRRRSSRVDRAARVRAAGRLSEGPLGAVQAADREIARQTAIRPGRWPSSPPPARPRLTGARASRGR